MVLVVAAARAGAQSSRASPTFVGDVINDIKKMMEEADKHANFGC